MGITLEWWSLFIQACTAGCCWRQCPRPDGPWSWGSRAISMLTSEMGHCVHWKGLVQRLWRNPQETLGTAEHYLSIVTWAIPGGKGHTEQQSLLLWTIWEAVVKWNYGSVQDSGLRSEIKQLEGASQIKCPLIPPYWLLHLNKCTLLKFALDPPAPSLPQKLGKGQEDTVAAKEHRGSVLFIKDPVNMVDYDYKHLENEKVCLVTEVSLKQTSVLWRIKDDYPSNCRT